eukprot:Polyplicarium_translucidae@DN927_c0_g1_i1.p2
MACQWSLERFVSLITEGTRGPQAGVELVKQLVVAPLIRFLHSELDDEDEHEGEFLNALRRQDLRYLGTLRPAGSVAVKERTSHAEALGGGGVAYARRLESTGVSSLDDSRPCRPPATLAALACLNFVAASATMSPSLRPFAKHLCCLGSARSAVRSGLSAACVVCVGL